MNLNEIPVEELELLSYTDLTYKLIKENKKAMNTPSLFKEICNLLEYSDEDYAEKIGDYYTSLTIDKRFVLIGSEWDIRDNHSIEIVIDDDDEIVIDDDIEEDEEVIEEEEKDIDEVIDDDIDDDIDELSIVTDDELDEE